MHAKGLGTNAPSDIVYYVGGKCSTLTANLSGVTWLRLRADPDGSSNSDHTDWAGPKLTCS